MIKFIIYDYNNHVSPRQRRASGWERVKRRRAVITYLLE